MARHFFYLEERARRAHVRNLELFDPDKLLSSTQEVAVGVGAKHGEWIDKTLALIAWHEQRSNGNCLCLFVRLPYSAPGGN